MIEYYAVFIISVLLGFAVGYGFGRGELESAYRQGLLDAETKLKEK